MFRTEWILGEKREAAIPANLVGITLKENTVGH